MPNGTLDLFNQCIKNRSAQKEQNPALKVKGRRCYQLTENFSFNNVKTHRRTRASSLTHKRQIVFLICIEDLRIINISIPQIEIL